MSTNIPADRAAEDRMRRPLAERMRPRSLDEMVGQEELLGPGKPLRRLLALGSIPSMILWGPPGSGKTTFARLLAHDAAAAFENLSAVMSGVKELREVVENARARRQLHQQRTILFVDELHRFNKTQQDALLPHVEAGLLTLVGATTENPSFEINAALLSRCRIFHFAALTPQAIVNLLQCALGDRERGLAGRGIGAPPEVLQAVAHTAEGDARRALNILEIAVELCPSGQTQLSTELVEQAAQHKVLLYDKSGEEHYNVVSAFIKSMRGSDPDAAVYWMVRMLEAGEEPRFILRRMVIFASEDVGNADPRALETAVAALHAFELVGLPEGVLPMTQAATYLACAPKSNAVITAYSAARKEVRERGYLPVPAKLRNAVTGLMKKMGYGQGYKYPHHFSGHYVEEDYLPEELVGKIFYQPSDQGEEKSLAARLAARRKR